jgi:hypothetical protein
MLAPTNERESLERERTELPANWPPIKTNSTPRLPSTRRGGSGSCGRFGGFRSDWLRLRLGWQPSAPSGRALCPRPGTERRMNAAGCARGRVPSAASRVLGRPGALDAGPSGSVASTWRRTARIRHATGHRGDRAPPEGRRVARPVSWIRDRCDAQRSCRCSGRRRSEGSDRR